MPWVAVPTTLVAQMDAAIGGKTAVDLERGKNLVGAFHWPARVVTDPELLATLPADELRNGLAEVVKTGLLSGEPLWELETAQQVRRCGCVQGRRLPARSPRSWRESAAEPRAHVRARSGDGIGVHASSRPGRRSRTTRRAQAVGARGRRAGRCSELLAPEPAAVDRDAAWAALGLDKKAVDGRPRLVLLEKPGAPRLGVELDEREIRSALDALIA